jgi:hypothetical protein
MNPTNPKEVFQAFQKDSAEELGRHYSSKWLVTSLGFSLQQMAAMGCSSEELTGARRFIQTLTNLHEKEKEPAKFPEKVLKTFDQPALTQTASPKGKTK